MKEDKITELYFRDVEKRPSSVDRRDFLKKLGGGIIIIFSVGEMGILNGCTFGRGSKEDDFNAYLRIKEDGRVDCFTGKIEMGQGVITSLAQVLAEELDVPMKHVDMIMGDTELCPYDAGTWGSMTTRFFDPELRAAAAEARLVLTELAASHLKVDKDQLKTADGKVFVASDPKKSVDYATLTKGQKIVRKPSGKAHQKTADEFRIVGKPVISMDAEVKVRGEAKFSGDIRLPGMKYARIKRPPAHGSKLVNMDGSAAEAMEGVELFQEGDFIFVLHDDPETAGQAIVRVKAEWEVSEAKANDQTIFDYFKQQITDSETFEEGGSLETGRTQSETLVEEEYYDGYKAHASIETHTATAEYTDGKLTMWASSQTPFGTRQAISDTLNLPLEKVHLKQIFLGGGFGGKIYNQQAIEAARIAIMTGKPVQLAWTRQEEFMYDMFRPAAVMKAVAGADKNGKLTSWEFDIYCAGSRGCNLFYEVPNNRSRTFNKNDVHPFGTGAWRAPGNNSTTFARESHIDVLAHRAGIDPIELRLKNMKEPRMKRTLELAVKTFGYEPGISPTGRGIGVALGFDAGTYVAIIAQVEVDKSTGKVTPVRIVCAQDMGQVVNPHGATVQTEGGITMGLGYALYEDVSFDWGKVNTSNFDDYEITRFAVTPEIESVFIDDMNAAPEGGGEPAIICVGGAIANAVFDASGARVFQMPITPERIMAALET
jgi:nicotinate dehydrogenase subunit B